MKHEFYRAKDVIRREAWPAEYVWIYDAAAAEYYRDRAGWDRRANEDAGTTSPGVSPHFLLLVDGKLVINAIGKNGWKRILAKRQELLEP